MDPEAETPRTQKGQSAYAQADTALWAESTETTCSVAVTVQKTIIGQKAQLIGVIKHTFEEKHQR